MHVREKPPLRLYERAITPAGKDYRWAQDEPNPENVPSGQRFSTTMPGGFETHDALLPRKPGVDYSDLERLSTIEIRGAGGERAAEYRLERAPQVSGDRMSVGPSAVGWQAGLEDDKSAVMPYVDQDKNSWQPPSLTRRGQIGNVPLDVDYRADAGAGFIQFEGPADTAGGRQVLNGSLAELHYRMPPGVRFGKAMYRGVEANTTSVEAANLFTDDNEAFASGSGNALTLDDTLRTVIPASIERYAMLRALATATHTPTAAFNRRFSKFAVYADHGLTTRAISGEPDGIYASDIVAHAVGTWAPMLVIDADSIQQSGFPIPHLVFFEPTTAGEIVRQATRFGLQDWAVWEGREFVWHQRGARGRKWRARISPAQLEETGPQVDRLWESIIVAYRDVDGSTRMVGPPGSGADTETSLLKDPDPDNPANKLGIVRRDLLQAGTETVSSATEIGVRFLTESKLLDTSGRARLVGHVEDDRGVLHPAWKPRAGDQIAFVDAADQSYRRIVKTDYAHEERTCTIDLDAPPEGLKALLERLGVALVPLGIA